MLDLQKDVKYITGVGPSRAETLKKIGIHTFKDLITHFPREYEDRTRVTPINQVMDNQDVLIEAVAITNVRERFVRKNMTIYQLMVH